MSRTARCNNLLAIKMLERNRLKNASPRKCTLVEAINIKQVEKESRRINNVHLVSSSKANRCNKNNNNLLITAKITI